jgi:hypothetical protein
MIGQESPPGQPAPEAGLSTSEGPEGGGLRKVGCRHATTRTDRSYRGNFLVLRTVCDSCGRIVSEENILLGLERFRCPVDPHLERCFLACPVEDGSMGVFEQPCEPVRKLMEDAGLVPSSLRPEPQSLA